MALVLPFCLYVVHFYVASYAPTTWEHHHALLVFCTAALDRIDMPQPGQPADVLDRRWAHTPNQTNQPEARS